MPVEDVLDQREPQAGAALRAAFSDVDPIEAPVSRGRCSGAMPGP